VTNEPDFRELVGDEGDPEELDRLRRVHELLVAAGPPPELSPALANPPEVEESKVLQFRRRRPATLLTIGIAAAAVLFLVGYTVGDRSTGFSAQGGAIPMHGVAQDVAARADIRIGSSDGGGNYPLQMTIRGLPHAPKGGWYELLLSKHGRPTLSCGLFAVDGGTTTVRLSVPYDLPDWHRTKRYDGWVVVLHTAGKSAAPIVMTT
jgi:hypothetical protein